MNRPGDARFPGLATALDTDAVLELLRGTLPECGDGIDLRSCTIQDVRYRPNGPCWILYRLKVRDADRRSSRHLLSARLLRPGEEPEPPPPELLARYEERGDRVLRTAVAHVREIPMAVYAFPLDTALPGLFDATDADAVQRHLGRMWEARKTRVRSVRVQPLGYTPHARAAFLYEVLAEDRRSGLPELRRLVAKMHAKKKTSRLFANAWATWRAGGRRIGLAPPVGYISAAEITLQEQVRGQRLGGLVTASGFRKWVRYTGRQLAELHRLSLPLTTRRKPADEIRSVDRWSGVLMAIRPELAPRVERLRDRLVAEIEARIRLSAPIHADFHHTNVLVDDDRITIIDLDEMAFGDPMVDVGRFLASLRVPARRAFGHIDALEDAGAAFLDAYLSKTDGDPRRARLFESASLLIAAGSSFRIQRRNWEEEVALLVEESEKVLEAAAPRSSTAPAAGKAEAARPELSPEDQARWASDAIYMQAALDPHIKKLYGAELTGCRIRGDRKRARGDGLRYELEGWRDGERWSITLRGQRRQSGGRSLIRRLEELDTAVAGSPEAPILPRPVAYIKALSLLIWEVPGGRSLPTLLEDGDAGPAAEDLARALAAIHRVPVALDKRRRPQYDLRKLRRRLDEMATRQPSLAATARPLLERIERRRGSVPERDSPTLGVVHPQHVLYTDGRVALSKLEDIALAHPYLDIADFLARLTLLGVQRARTEETREVARRFRAAYRAAGSAHGDGLASFEAAALLRLSCSQAERDPEGDLAQQLLERARVRLES